MGQNGRLRGRACMAPRVLQSLGRLRSTRRCAWLEIQAIGGAACADIACEDGDKPSIMLVGI